MVLAHGHYRDNKSKMQKSLVQQSLVTKSGMQIFRELLQVSEVLGCHFITSTLQKSLLCVLLSLVWTLDIESNKVCWILTWWDGGAFDEAFNIFESFNYFHLSLTLSCEIEMCTSTVRFSLMPKNAFQNASGFSSHCHTLLGGLKQVAICLRCIKQHLWILGWAEIFEMAPLLELQIPSDVLNIDSFMHVFTHVFMHSSCRVFLFNMRI